MSRTYRRKAKWLEREHLGTFEELFVVSAFGPNVEPYYAYKARKLGMTNEKYFARLRARFKGDHSTWMLGVPRWYRHMTGSHRNRVRESQKIIRCLQAGTWDNHLPESRARGMDYYW